MKRWDYNYLFPIRGYLDSEGHETDEKMRFVDMCIEVDSNIPRWNDKDSEGNWVVDKDRQFNLIYSVCFMLACKQLKLRDGREYDDFAYFLAYDIFDKIERPRNLNAPVKSLLNYAKSILVWRKIQFLTAENNKILDPLYTKGWDGDTFKNNIITSLESTTKLNSIEEVRSYFADFGETIRENIPVQFRTDKVLYKYLYVSVCLSLIKAFKNNAMKKNTSLLDSGIVLFGPTADYKDIIRMAFNKSLLELGNKIKDTIDKYRISDAEYQILMGSAFDNVSNDK